jgi:hypothetical protein
VEAAAVAPIAVAAAAAAARLVVRIAAVAVVRKVQEVVVSTRLSKSLYVDGTMYSLPFRTLTLVLLLFLNCSIAFKPAESGWGAGKKYNNNYDNIFGKKQSEDTPSSTSK